MSEAKNTHVAVHAIQFRDEKGAYEIAPGTQFAPAEIKQLDVAHLEAAGAISPIKVEKKAAAAESGKADKAK